MRLIFVNWVNYEGFLASFTYDGGRCKYIAHTTFLITRVRLSYSDIELSTNKVLHFFHSYNLSTNSQRVTVCMFFCLIVEKMQVYCLRCIQTKHKGHYNSLQEQMGMKIHLHENPSSVDFLFIYTTDYFPAPFIDNLSNFLSYCVKNKHVPVIPITFFVSPVS